MITHLRSLLARAYQTLTNLTLQGDKNITFDLTVYLTLQGDKSVPESPMEPAEIRSGPVSLGSMSAVSLTRGVDVVGKVGRIEEGAGGTAERKVRYNGTGNINIAWIKLFASFDMYRLNFL